MVLSRLVNLWLRWECLWFFSPWSGCCGSSSIYRPYYPAERPSPYSFSWESKQSKVGGKSHELRRTQRSVTFVVFHPINQNLVYVNTYHEWFTCWVNTLGSDVLIIDVCMYNIYVCVYVSRCDVLICRDDRICCFLSRLLFTFLHSYIHTHTNK